MTISLKLLTRSLVYFASVHNSKRRSKEWWGGAEMKSARLYFYIYYMLQHTKHIVTTIYDHIITLMLDGAARNNEFHYCKLATLDTVQETRPKNNNNKAI